MFDLGVIESIEKKDDEIVVELFLPNGDNEEVVDGERDEIVFLGEFKKAWLHPARICKSCLEKQAS